MASFSFGAGNARKLRRIPLYLAGRLVTAIVPRSRDEWVFGCAVGIADGALALHRVADAHGEKTTWLVADEAQAREAERLGIRCVVRDSLRGFWRTARARVIVVTHGFGDAQRYAEHGALLVQLWHGIPLKRIGLDSPATTQVPDVPGAGLLRRAIAVLYRAAAQRIRVLPAASDRSRGRLESAFGLPSDRVVVTGEPRVDVLSAGSPEERRAGASARLRTALDGLPDSSTVVLYAPTWRDGAADPAVPSAEDWVRIIRVLEDHDAVLLIRSHPLGEGRYAPPLPSRRVRMLGAAVLADVTPVLPAVDVLITDYSSLAYDVGLLAMPVLFLAPDAQEYAVSRGFYGRFGDVAGADAATSWPDVLAQLERLLSDEASFTERARRSATLSAEMHAFRDGRNTERVYGAIRARGIRAPKGAV